MFQVTFHIAKRRGPAFTVRAIGRTRGQAVKRFAKRLNACQGAAALACDVLCAGSKLYASVTHNGAQAQAVRIDRFKGVKTLSVIDGNYYDYRAANIRVDAAGRHYDAQAVEAIQGQAMAARSITAVEAIQGQALNDDCEIMQGVNDGETTHILWPRLLRFAA